MKGRPMRRNDGLARSWVPQSLQSPHNPRPVFWKDDCLFLGMRSVQVLRRWILGSCAWIASTVVTSNVFSGLALRALAHEARWVYYGN